MLLWLVEEKLSLLQLLSLHQLQLSQVLAAETKIQTFSPLLILPGGMYVLHVTAHHSYRMITNTSKIATIYFPGLNFCFIYLNIHCWQNLVNSVKTATIKEVLILHFINA